MLTLTCPSCRIRADESELAPSYEAHLKRFGPGSNLFRDGRFGNQTVAAGVAHTLLPKEDLSYEKSSARKSFVRKFFLHQNLPENGNAMRNAVRPQTEPPARYPVRSATHSGRGGALMSDTGNQNSSRVVDRTVIHSTEMLKCPIFMLQTVPRPSRRRDISQPPLNQRSTGPALHRPPHRVLVTRRAGPALAPALWFAVSSVCWPFLPPFSILRQKFQPRLPARRLKMSSKAMAAPCPFLPKLRQTSQTRSRPMRQLQTLPWTSQPLISPSHPLQQPPLRPMPMPHRLSQQLLSQRLLTLDPRQLTLLRRQSNQRPAQQLRLHPRNPDALIGLGFTAMGGHLTVPAHFHGGARPC